MKKEDFDKNLKEVSMTRKEFAKITGVQYTTVGKWNDNDRPVPEWVDSWMQNYIKSQELERLKSILGSDR